jgi:hypothetical protein
MTWVEQKIQEFEQRPAVFDDAEQSRRAAMLRHFVAINKFEGLIPSSIDEHMLELLAAGKISKQEYLSLCLTDARGTV